MAGRKAAAAPATSVNISVCVPRTTSGSPPRTGSGYGDMKVVSFSGSPTPRASSCSRRRCTMKSMAPSLREPMACERSTSTVICRLPSFMNAAALTG